MDIQSFALGFAGGAAFVGNVWIWTHIKIFLNARKRFMADVKRGLHVDVVA
ncbi:hypothetical protein [Tardiphaga robiniae]|uniref:Uncharacterized protein n=1 Tax=Tardiphaga robiniae TaxID=943830 RepID=A0A7G6TVM8_9BRAD|nr:hypothetical protein [Tardiphaga robiniae]QND70810.1 hypothetical protein HB776_05855 [Tardiphaga robiniae]